MAFVRYVCIFLIVTRILKKVIPCLVCAYVFGLVARIFMCGITNCRTSATTNELVSFHQSYNFIHDKNLTLKARSNEHPITRIHTNYTANYLLGQRRPCSVSTRNQYWNKINSTTEYMKLCYFYARWFRRTNFTSF